MKSQSQPKEPVGRKTYTDPETGTKKQGALIPLAKIRADEIWTKVKPYVDQFEIFGNRIIVGVFKTEEKTQSGIYLPDSVREEDVWQGVTGLVLRCGPTCFKDSDKWKFGGQSVDINDWIAFNPAHTHLIKLGGQYDGIECRIIQDCYIIAKVDGPHVVR